MVTTKTLIKALADNPEFHDPAMLVSELNRILNWDNPRNMFVTLIVAVLDLRSGEIAYCNSGHNPPIHVGNGSTDYIKAKSGPFPNLKFKPLSHKLKKGEMLFLYTDGVTEAENAEKAQYTDKRLLKTVKVNQNQSAGSLIETVASDVKAHVGNTAQSDDITMLAIRFNG